MTNDKTTLDAEFYGATVQKHLTTAIEHGEKWIEDYNDNELFIFMRSEMNYDICAVFEIFKERLIYKSLDIEGREFKPLTDDKIKVINIAHKLYNEELDAIAAENEPCEPPDTMESLGFSNSDFIFP